MKIEISTDIPKDDRQEYNVGKPKIVPFLIFVLLIVIILYFYIVPLWSIVNSKLQFFALMSTLLFLAFIFSLTESAFSKIDSNNRMKLISYFTDVRNEITDNLIELNKKIRDLETEGNNNNYNIEIEKNLKKHEKEIKKWTKYKRKINNIRKFILQSNNKRIVGSLATISVFLNAAVAVFLPWTFKNENLLPVNLPFTSVDISSKEWFVFFISSIPILFIGKVLPKYLGLLFPIYLAVKL